MSQTSCLVRFTRILAFTVLAGLLLSGCGIIPTYGSKSEAIWNTRRSIP